MAMTSINVRVDEQVKERFGWFCENIGMNVTTAINVFMKAALLGNKFPFELKADPFYNEANMRHIMKGIRAFENGDRGRPLTAEELEALGLE